MIVLTTSSSAQTFSFIPRTTGYNVMQITDEIENKTSTVAITSSIAGGYTHSITATFDLVEGKIGGQTHLARATYPASGNRKTQSIHSQSMGASIHL